MHLARGRTSVLTLMVSALVLTACLPVPDPGPPPPPLGPIPEIEPYAGTDCLDVLIIGDSIASFVGDRFASLLGTSGRCATVRQEGVAGSGVVDWVPGGIFDLTPHVTDDVPDVVFAFFVGNESFSGLRWSAPDWEARTTAAALQLVDLVPDGVPIYWAVPPRGAWRCEWGSLNDQRWLPWHTWIRDTLPVLRESVSLVDWRVPFGGENYQPAYVFPDGNAHDVRLPDCVHFSAIGADLAAKIAVAAMQDEWTSPSAGPTAVAPPPPGVPEPAPSPSSTTTTAVE